MSTIFLIFICIIVGFTFTHGEGLIRVTGLKSEMLACLEFTMLFGVVLIAPSISKHMSRLESAALICRILVMFVVPISLLGYALWFTPFGVGTNLSNPYGCDYRTAREIVDFITITAVLSTVAIGSKSRPNWRKKYSVIVLAPLLVYLAGLCITANYSGMGSGYAF